MLTAIGAHDRPLFEAKEINDFYLENTPCIFPSKYGIIFRMFFGPKHDGKYLHKKVRQLLGEKKLQETLTNLVVPTYDIKLKQPTIFSTFEAKEDLAENVLLSDICIGTSAAPTYLPPHYFETKDNDGQIREFNLIDGGIAANNPTFVAMKLAMRYIMKTNDDSSIKLMDGTRFLVLSLGTGSAKIETKLSAKAAAKWGILRWLNNKNDSPLISSFSEASSDMTDINVGDLFADAKCMKNYLRIQDNTLVGETASVDNATEENLRNLVRIGKDLLKKSASRMNTKTGLLEAVDGGVTTNEEELTRFAKLLSDEKRLRNLNAAQG